MTITKEGVLHVVQQHGPIIPNDIKKHIGEGDTFIIGAVLSELKANGALKVSNTKCGGSPFYYAVGHDAKLEGVMKFLNEKDLRTAQRLKEEKVIRDKGQEPLTRVSLRQIKDYSRPLEVKYGEERVLFWKYYLVPNSDAEPIIRKLLGQKPPAPTPEKEPLKEAREEPRKEPERREEPVREAPKEEPKKEDAGAFYDDIKDYFESKNIEVAQEEAVRKQSEWDFELKMPSAAGELSYYCKAVKKKTINDKDLSSAYVEGEQRKLPVLFLTTGKLTKKAEQKLEKEFRNITVNQL